MRKPFSQCGTWVTAECGEISCAVLWCALAHDSNLQTAIFIVFVVMHNLFELSTAPLVDKRCLNNHLTQWNMVFSLATGILLEFPLLVWRVALWFYWFSWLLEMEESNTYRLQTVHTKWHFNKSRIAKTLQYFQRKRQTFEKCNFKKEFKMVCLFLSLSNY